MKAEMSSRLYNNLNEEGVFLSYQGPLWQELLEELNGLVKKNVGMKFKSAVLNRYLILMIEMIQNIIRYSSTKSPMDDGPAISQGSVLIGSQDDLHFIIAGNTVDSYHKNILEESLSKLDDCDKKTLNLLYLEQIRGENHEKSYGAGLGLIDIYRKAEKVEYTFSKDNRDNDFFALKVEFSS